jgi:hypothetical protein
MSTPDLITILGNLSQSLVPVEKLITGSAYVLGIFLVFSGLTRLKQLSESHGREKMFHAVGFFVAGALLIFIPSTIKVIANSTFGTGNVLEYVQFNRLNFFTVMGVIIQVVGLFWAVRGAIMIITASQPGKQEGMRGVMFLVAGILAIHFDNTVAVLNAFLSKFTSFTIHVSKQ